MEASIAKARARDAVESATARGEIPRPRRCESCGVEQDATGKPDIHNHHHSYLPEHRLDVIPLCAGCHRRVHYGSLPEPRTGRVYFENHGDPTALTLIEAMRRATCPHCGAGPGEPCVGLKKRRGQPVRVTHRQRAAAAADVAHPDTDAGRFIASWLRRNVVRRDVPPCEAVLPVAAKQAA